MDIYPFYQSANNIEEDKKDKIDNSKKEEEKFTTKENNVSSSGLIPIETVINPIVPAVVPAVTPAPVITNNEFYPMEEIISNNNNVVAENLPEDIDCLWEENDSFIV